MMRFVAFDVMNGRMPGVHLAIAQQRHALPMGERTYDLDEVGSWSARPAIASGRPWNKSVYAGRYARKSVHQNWVREKLGDFCAARAGQTNY
jgi:hypothetical protein